MWILFCVLAVVFLGLILAMQSMANRQSEAGKAFRLLRKMIAHEPAGAEHASHDQRFRWGQQVRARMPRIDERMLRPLLHGAGLYAERQADVAVVMWSALLCAAIILAAALPGPTPLWCLLCLLAAVLGPCFYLRTRASRRRKVIARGLPDVIDLLVICVEAGLGLDQAILRVREELADTHPEIRTELDRLMQHQRAGMPRLEAWQRMAERLNVPEIDAFVAMILQTERFGTPIARALTEFAALSRQKRTQAAAHASAKTTVKISFPLVLFIFPCIFIVLLGPALLNMMRSLTEFLH